MKKSILLAACFALLAYTGFAQKSTQPKSTPQEDTIQYSLGVYMMQQLLAKTGYTVNDPVLFKKAIDDVMLGKKLMVNPATTEARLLAYQKTYREQRGRQLEALLFAKIKGQPGFTALPSGVNYAMVKAGQGIRPTAKDTIILNVTSTLADGTVIEDANTSKQSYMAIAGEMIPGLREVLYRMQEGSISRVIVPASQAYGSQGTATIPPNSALIYDIALVSVKQPR